MLPEPIGEVQVPSSTAGGTSTHKQTLMHGLQHRQPYAYNCSNCKMLTCTNCCLHLQCRSVASSCHRIFISAN